MIGIKNKRLKILEGHENNDIFGIPVFTNEEIDFWFDFDADDLTLINSRKKLESKLDLMIQFVYFKIRKRFFDYDINAKNTKYIAKKFFKEAKKLKKLGKTQIFKNRKLILSYFNFTQFDSKTHIPILLNHAKELIKKSQEPKFLADELLNFLNKNNITVPGYTTLQESVISAAITDEHKRIFTILEKELDETQKKNFLDLLVKTDKDYGISVLKKDAKNFKYTAVKEECDKFLRTKSLFEIGKSVLEKLNLSNTSVSYFSSLVDHYSLQGLSRIDRQQVLLWLICFVFERHKKITDNLATMLIYLTSNFEEVVKTLTEELFEQSLIDDSPWRKSLIKLLQCYVGEKINKEISFYKHVQNIHKFFNQDQIQKAILSFEKKRSKEKENFKWIAVDKISSSYKNRIQLIIQCLDFYGVQGVWLREVHEFLKDFFQKRRIIETINYEDIPKNHIFSKDKKYILDEKNKNIKFSRFEFDFYIKTGKAISHSTLFVKNSILYTSLEDELLTDWNSCKIQIIKELDNSFLKNTLSDFVNIYAKPIDEKIEKLNKDIQDGTNKSIKIKTDKTGQKTWTFPYPTRWSQNKNKYLESIQSFSISHILKIVNEQTGFLKAFTHIKPHYSKSKMDDISVFACLIASATGMGIYKMAQICDLSFQELNTSWKNYIRLSTLRAANDKIANALFMLPIFKNWTLHDTLLFASADGQKINTQKELLMSRYGKKYFGRGKGVVANTLVCNHVPLNMRLIGPHCHESHYLFDLCYNNTTEIDPDVVSTDTEGVNQLNTLLLEVIYKRFAPRYKNFKERIQNLMSFQPHYKFKDCIINPTRTFNLNLVRSEYDNILHIIASLLTGHMNQSYIVKKLNSTHLKNNTKNALWEMNAILESHWLIDIIQDQSLRQASHGALCQGESYHSLFRAIRKTAGEALKGTTELELMISAECTRLVANCVIFFNAIILNHLKSEADKNNNLELSKNIEKSSPIAFAHINFHGKYTFLDEMPSFSINDFLNSLKID